MTLETITVELPREVADGLRTFVETGEYSSTDEVIHEALIDWNHKRVSGQALINELRQKIEEAEADDVPGSSAEEVFSRLRTKYPALTVPEPVSP